MNDHAQQETTMRTHHRISGRLAALLLSAILALPHVGSARAAEVTLTGGSGTVPAGTTGIIVPIGLTNDVPVRGLQFEIRDVPDALTLVPVAAGASACAPRAAAAGATCLVNEIAADRITVLVLNLSGGVIPVGEGPVVNLTLHYKDGVCTPGAAVALELDAVEIGGASGEALDTVPVDGTVLCGPGATPTPVRTPGPGLVDPKRAFACQTKVADLARRLLDKRLAGLQKCVGALLKCEFDGSFGCEGKSRATCGAAFAKIEDGELAFVDKIASKTKCDTAVLFGAKSLGFEPLQEECSSRFGVTVVGARSVAQCLLRLTRCTADDLLSKQIPQSRIQLEGIGRQLGGGSCTVP